MIIIAHRQNKITDLKKLPKKFGVEIDIRHDNRNNRLYLNHEVGDGDDLEEYLRICQNRFVVFNIKEAGTEQQCIDLAAKYVISDYFLQDVEFPYFYRATRKEGVRKIAVRYSEAEPIEFALAQKGFCDWIWIDTNTRLPLDKNSAGLLAKNFKTCLVSPDRWGRSEDIPVYKKMMDNQGFRLDAVMCNLENIKFWE